jgi:hypothetical protein
MRRFLLVTALALLAPAQARAQSWLNYWTQCTPGSLRSCATTEIGFTEYTEADGSTWSLLLVKMQNLQGLAGYESGPRGFREMVISGVEGPAPQIPDFGEHHATEGSVVTRAFIDNPYTLTGSDGRLAVSWNFDYASLLYGCDLEEDAVAPGDFGWFYDQTCGGSITYGIRLMGSYRFDERLPAITYRWRAFEDESPQSGDWTSCTTGVDCSMVTPEPVTTVLMATGLLGIAAAGALRRRKRGR